MNPLEMLTAALRTIKPFDLWLKIVLSCIMGYCTFFYCVSFLFIFRLEDKAFLELAITCLMVGAGIIGLYAPWWLIMKFHNFSGKLPIKIEVFSILLILNPVYMAYRYTFLHARQEGFEIALLFLSIPIIIEIFLLFYSKKISKRDRHS